MIINPIVMEGGRQVQERRSGWLRSVDRNSTGTGTAASNRTPVESEGISSFNPNDQLSKGLAGRVMTTERQEKIDLSYGVQVADRGMEAINERLQQAKDDLAEIHKMFPPYPHGSEERAEFLNSYKSLRLQIDKLTFPPESDTAAQIMGGTDLSGTPPEIGQFPVGSGSEGLNLMELSKPVEELTDAELPAIIKDLERASGVLDERRIGLKESAEKIFNQESGENEEFAKLSVDVQDKFAASDLSITRFNTGIHQKLSFLD